MTTPEAVAAEPMTPAETMAAAEAVTPTERPMTAAEGPVATERPVATAQAGHRQRRYRPRWTR